MEGNNSDYWNAYEKATGKKRPPWIDGIGNVNWHYGAKDPPAPRTTPSIQAAMRNMPRVQAAPMSQELFQTQLPRFKPPANPWSANRGWGGLTP